MGLSPGTKLGPYEILAPLGAGGMGEVYKAHDPRLGRDVAIKISAERFSERFEREARAVAALNHPNICTLYDVGPNYLVMEYIDGESPQGPLPLDAALGIARQVADALDAAHERGIVHRDLKPANIKIKTNGTVKVLDFGLAKIALASTGNSQDSPTFTMGATQAGMILGTAPYMSPEQARGKAVDNRTDIWAFGVMLWELLTGRMLFDGEAVTDILAQVLTKEPDWSQVPAEVRRLLRSCLQKDLKQRLRAIGDWQILLEAPLAEAVPARPVRLPWAIAGLLAAALAFTGWFAWHRPAAAARVPYNLYMVPPEGATLRVSASGGLQAISPDGHSLAFIAESQGTGHVWVRPLDSSTARPLAGTELAQDVFWSPDARFLGFSTGNNLKIVEVATGAVKDLCDGGSNVRGATWNNDGTIVFSTIGAPLMRIRVDGGTPQPVTVYAPGRENNHTNPQFLPDGKHFLYWVRGVKPEATGIYAGSLDTPPEQQIHHLIVPTPRSALYASGYLLFVRGKTLFAQPFDPGKLALSGSPTPVVDNVPGHAGTPSFSVSNNGILAVSNGAGLLRSMTIVSSTGAAIETLGQPDSYISMRLSPDGSTAALMRSNVENATADIWLMELARKVPVRWTDEAAMTAFPVWSPDGKTIVFSCNREGAYQIYRKAIGGDRAAELVQSAKSPQRASDWSRERGIAYWEHVSPGHDGLRLLPDVAGSRPVTLSAANASNLSPRFSPSNRWMAFGSDETSRFEIYVQALPGPSVEAAPKIRISNSGGLNPAWSADGHELFFNSLDDRLMSVTVRENGVRFEAGEPKQLFALGGNSSFNGAVYWEPIENGKRFLVLRPAPLTESENRINILVDWMSALKK